MQAIMTHASRTFGHIRDAVSDMNYAQRRLLEIRLGMPPRRNVGRRARLQIEELEALYQLEPRTPITSDRAARVLS